MFDGVVPAVVRWAVAPGAAELADLWAEEAAVVASAAPVRQREFAAGRVAAHLALAALGAPAAPVLAACRRPTWPPDVVGSITHCPGLTAAAVARRRDLRAIGIDAEPAVPLGADVVDVVSTADERRAIGGAVAGTVVFSAKESFYKCWSALDGGLLEFDDVVLAARPDGSFVARPPDGGAWPGRWAVRDGFVVTAAWAAP